MKSSESSTATHRHVPLPSKLVGYASPPGISREIDDAVPLIIGGNRSPSYQKAARKCQSDDIRWEGSVSNVHVRRQRCDKLGEDCAINMLQRMC